MKITPAVVKLAKDKLPNPRGMHHGEKYLVLVTDKEMGLKTSKGNAIVEFILDCKYGWCLISSVEDQMLMPEDPRERKTDAGRGEKGALHVVDFSGTPAPSGENVIKRLEEALAMAKEGNVSNVAVVLVQESGDVMNCWANSSKPFAMVGGLESLKLDFMNGCIEGR